MARPVGGGGTKQFGLQAIAKDLGIDHNARLFNDSRAAIGIVRRRGGGGIATPTALTYGGKSASEVRGSLLIRRAVDLTLPTCLLRP